jgi:3-isopropylmalate/(R)-2-methylmalate dehydratase small subunit
MEKFVTLEAVAACLPEANVNTDDILPSVWVLNPNTDLGEKLFANRRYDGSGRENPDFVLNQLPYRHARIFISGPNFGCGSSREAAVWALSRFGIRCLIAPSYGDIFYENCLQNGVLPMVLDASCVNQLIEALALADGKTLTVNLTECSVKAPGLEPVTFAIAEERREALLRGQDAVTQLLSLQPEVDAFERRDVEERPWIYRIGDESLT